MERCYIWSRCGWELRSKRPTSVEINVEVRAIGTKVEGRRKDHRSVLCSAICTCQLLLSRRRQQSLQCGRCTCPPEAASVVMRQTPGAATGLQTFSGSLSALGVRFGAVTTPYREPFVGERVSLFREPDAGNLLVRFDEREQETGSSQTGLRGRGRKLGHTPTGRLSSLRLFSTLLPI